MEKKNIYFVVIAIAILVVSAVAIYKYTYQEDYGEFKKAVESIGIDVHKVYRMKDTLIVEYTPNIENQFQAIAEVGNIIYNFIDYRDEYNTPNLMGRVVDEEEALGGTWVCKGELIDAYEEGNTCFNDLLFTVLATIEVTEG